MPAYPKNNTGYKLGESALLINHDTGKSVMCVIGEVGPEKNGWGEVSIATILDTGNPGHNSANNDPPGIMKLLFIQKLLKIGVIRNEKNIRFISYSNFITYCLFNGIQKHIK